MGTDGEFVAGNLVRWLNGTDALGFVKGVVYEGTKVVVHFDDGQQHIFAADTDALERVVLREGAHVEIKATGAVGAVVGATPAAGRLSYTVSLAGGGTTSVLEDGVRPAVIDDPIELLRSGELDPTRSTNLRLAATRLAFANESDTLSSLSNSRVEIKPHQVGVVHRVMGGWPHRFILADEVGLGKTIEAGLIIKELRARGLAKRVLVLAPSGLVHQWQFEMKTKFNETFARFDRSVLNYLAGKHGQENPWTLEDNVIVSTSFATRNEERRKEIALAGWDLVVIDEAHHARRRMQADAKYESTNLYRLAEELNDPNLGGASSCLFLTATPMQLHPYELYALVELLDPTLFPSFSEFENHRDELAGLNALVETFKGWEGLSTAKKREVQSEIAARVANGVDLDELVATPAGREEVQDRLVSKHCLSEVMVRNRKAVVGDFQPRVATTWEVDLTPNERAAYDAVTEYVRTGYDRAQRSQSLAIGFLMTTFQKLLSSSSRALAATMVKRIEKLEREAAPEGGSEVEDEDLEEREVSSALDPVLAVGAYEATTEECQELEGIVDMLDEIDIDSKARVLRDRLATEIADEDPDAKVIIFTQFRNTQEYLKEILEGKPWNVNLFHGGLKPDEKDEAVETFRAAAGPQLLISTEAGGEGRNFQFCHLMVNYDLPWNPMKVEQRIGRIDRIGQKHPVKIFNLSTTDTIEERILAVLNDRIRLFEETVGGLDPILGEVERDLKEMLTLAEEEQERRLEEYERMLEDRVHEAREAEKKRADFIMDMRSYRQDEVDKLLDRRGETTNEDLQRFVLGALDELDCKITKDPALTGVFDLKLSERFIDLFPGHEKEGRTRRVAFNPSVALDYETVEFFAFGHPIVDGLVERTRAKGYAGRATTRRVLTHEIPPVRGWLFVYTVELDGVISARELFPVFIDERSERQDEVARFLLERASTGKREDYGETPLPDRGASFDETVREADSAALACLIERQADLTTANADRLEAERAKLERFYEYKVAAAGRKLERVRETFERVSESQDLEVQKIIPVWAKNLENAKRLVEQIGEERTERLRKLEGCEQVAARHSLLSAAYVEVWPDPGELDGAEIDQSVRRSLRHLCQPSSADDIEAKGREVLVRRQRLRSLAEKHSFDLPTAEECADRLVRLCKKRSAMNDAERFLLRGATEYFLLLADDHHDVKDPSGFNDDLAVVKVVEAAVV